MVDVRNIESLRQHRSGDAARTPKQEAKNAYSVAWTFVRDHMLKNHGGRDLGPIVQRFLRGAADQLVGQIEARTGRVPAEAIKALIDQGIDVATKEAFVDRRPNDVSEKNGELRGKLSLRDNPDGSMKAVGEATADTQALAKMAKGLGLDLGALDPTVAKVFGEAAGDFKLHNIGRMDTWRQVGQRALTAMIGTPGPWQAKGVAAAAAGVEALGQALMSGEPKAPKKLAAPDRLGMGLESKASTETGRGTVHNVTNIQAALMSGVSGQGQVVEATARKVAAAVYKELGRKPDKAEHRKIHAMLTGLIRDKSSPQGHVRSVELLERTAQKLAEKDPTQAAVAELAGIIRAATEGEAELPVGFDQVLDAASAEALASLVSLEIGEQPTRSASLLSGLQSAVAELKKGRGKSASEGPRAAPEGKAKAANGKQQSQRARTNRAPEPDLSQWRGNSDIPARFTTQAVQLLQNMQVDSSHPNFIPMRNAIGEILSNTAVNGQAHIPRFALGLLEFCVQHCGVPASKLESAAHSLDKLGGCIDAAGQELARLETQKKELEEQAGRRGAAGRAAFEGKIADLEKEIRLVKAEMAHDFERLGEWTDVTLADALPKFREFMGAPEGMAAAAGGGGRGGIGGNGHDGVGGGEPPGGGVGGPGGPGEPPKGSKVFGNMPGMTYGGRPSDAVNPEQLTIQQRRAVKCGEILADPALTIEDKIFLFMMWFVAFSDEEREKKLQELVQMDRKTANLQEAKDDKLAELKSQETTAAEQSALLAGAEAELKAVLGEGVSTPSRASFVMAQQGELRGKLEKLEDQQTGRVQDAEARVQQLENEANALLGDHANLDSAVAAEASAGRPDVAGMRRPDRVVALMETKQDLEQQLATADAAEHPRIQAEIENVEADLASRGPLPSEASVARFKLERAKEEVSFAKKGTGEGAEELAKVKAQLKDLESEVVGFRKKYGSIEAAVDKSASNGHPDIRTLNNQDKVLAALDKVETQRNSLKVARGEVAKLENELNALQRKEDFAPKSREVLFMELERLNQLRDKIMNMARSILENSNRNIEKVFR